MKCIFLRKRLRETHAGGQRQPGCRIHITSWGEIYTAGYRRKQLRLKHLFQSYTRTPRQMIKRWRCRRREGGRRRSGETGERRAKEERMECGRRGCVCGSLRRSNAKEVDEGGRRWRRRRRGNFDREMNGAYLYKLERTQCAT